MSLILLGVIVLLTPVGAALSDLVVDEPSSGLTPPVPENPVSEDGSDSDEPDLSMAQEQEAVDLIAEDSKVAAILGDTGYEIKELGPWGGDNGQAIIGAAAVLGLTEPTAFQMQEWPIIEYTPGKAAPYEQQSFSMAAQNATQLLISVDLQRDAVVSVEPYGDNLKITPGEDLQKAVTAPTGE